MINCRNISSVFLLCAGGGCVRLGIYFNNFKEVIFLLLLLFCCLWGVFSCFFFPDLYLMSSDDNVYHSG